MHVVPNISACFAISGLFSHPRKRWETAGLIICITDGVFTDFMVSFVLQVEFLQISWTINRKVCS